MAVHVLLAVLAGAGAGWFERVMLGQHDLIVWHLSAAQVGTFAGAVRWLAIGWVCAVVALALGRLRWWLAVVPCLGATGSLLMAGGLALVAMAFGDDYEHLDVERPPGRELVLQRKKGLGDHIATLYEGGPILYRATSERLDFDDMHMVPFEVHSLADGTMVLIFEDGQRMQTPRVARANRRGSPEGHRGPTTPSW